jgi:hypothetical protein
MAFKVPEKMRLRIGDLGSDESYGNNGAFFVNISSTLVAFCIASDGKETDWEHVSVSLFLRKKTAISVKRCPTWEEMCMIKDMFWTDDDCVIQFHPPKAHYVNYHSYCLHLWRYTKIEQTLPPDELIGYKNI